MALFVTAIATYAFFLLASPHIFCLSTQTICSQVISATIFVENDIALQVIGECRDCNPFLRHRSCHNWTGGSSFSRTLASSKNWVILLLTTGSRGSAKQSPVLRSPCYKYTRKSTSRHPAIRGWQQAKFCQVDIRIFVCIQALSYGVVVFYE